METLGAGTILQAATKIALYLTWPDFQDGYEGLATKFAY